MLLLIVSVGVSCRTATEAEKPQATSQRREISWQEAKHLLASAPIKRVFLAHSYGLMFELRGEEYWTVVPDHGESDWVWKTMARRRESGDPIEFLAE